jgi:hypothetical protein
MGTAALANAEKRARPIAEEANRAGWEKVWEIYCPYSGDSNGSSPDPAEAVAHFGLAADSVMCHGVAVDSS